MKIRIRVHQLPGDIPRREKIAMWEGRSSRPGAKSCKRMHLARERAIFKRGTREEIEDSL